MNKNEENSFGWSVLRPGWSLLALEGFCVDFSHPDSIHITRSAKERSITVADVERVKSFVRPDCQHMVYKADYHLILIT